ncbi:MAG: hypothetical protein JWQ35_1273 [Bacteriovoracaceae bacterium]|nr:hypothetical protein [Bacteriovoracaceae bacterium]
MGNQIKKQNHSDNHLTYRNPDISSDSELGFVDFLEDNQLQIDPTDYDQGYEISKDLRKELMEWVQTHRR